MTSVVRAYAGGFVSKIVESGDYPMTARNVIETNDSPDMDEEFRAGLAIILDGIGAAMPKRSTGNARR